MDLPVPHTHDGDASRLSPVFGANSNNSSSSSISVFPYIRLLDMHGGYRTLVSRLTAGKTKMSSSYDTNIMQHQQSMWHLCYFHEVSRIIRVTTGTRRRVSKKEAFRIGPGVPWFIFRKLWFIAVCDWREYCTLTAASTPLLCSKFCGYRLSQPC